MTVNKKISEICWACTEPILEDEMIVWAIPTRYGEDEQPHHEECQPYTFMIEVEEPDERL